MGKLRPGLIVLSAALCIGQASAQSAVVQPPQEFNSEVTLYVYCSWMSGDLVRSTTQVQEMRWRDTVYVYPTFRSVSVHSGVYIGALEESFKSRLDANVDCEGRTSPGYAYASQEPGATPSIGGGRFLTMTLHEVTPDWFFLDRFADNIVSVSGMPKSARKKVAAGESVVSSSPAARGTGRTSGRGPGALTVKTDTSLIDARKKYEQAVLQSQRDDAAARAKQVADTARNRAEMQLKLNKFFEELRKRGSAQ